MTTIKIFEGCEMPAAIHPNASPLKKEICGAKDVCEICRLCEKHCIEHMGNRYGGFRMVKTQNIKKVTFKSELAA